MLAVTALGERMGTWVDTEPNPSMFSLCLFSTLRSPLHPEHLPHVDAGICEAQRTDRCGQARSLIQGAPLPEGAGPEALRCMRQDRVPELASNWQWNDSAQMDVLLSPRTQ